MRTDVEILNSIITRKDSIWSNFVDTESMAIIKNKIAEIPTQFYEQRITIDATNGRQISLLEFTLTTANMAPERRNGLMRKYNIDPYDMDKLQRIIESIKVVSEYGSLDEVKKKENSENKTISYGIALSDKKQLDKAYPLWIAYLYADSKNPYDDIRMRLIHDGTDNKYEPEYIVGLIEHTKSLLGDKTSEEQKDFFISSISDILDDTVEMLVDDEIEI